VCAAVLVALVLVPAPAVALGENEPFIAQQWGLRQIDAQQAWTVSRGAGAIVGVIDTGVDLQHEELAGGTIIASTRCTGTSGRADRCSGSAQDDNGHGTHVAGTIAAPLNGKGIAGVAPEAKLLVVKALAADGGGDAVDVAAAIDWVAARGANVVNLSLADATEVGQVLGSPIETAIRRYAASGVVFVLAGGNRADDGSAATGAKGGYGDLPALVVASTGPDGAPARYNLPLGTARWGLAAPGGDGSASQPEREIVSTYWYAQQRNGYAWSEGTSMAAPHVAAVAALLAAQGITGRAAIDRIIATVHPLDCGTGCHGRLDARAAVGAPVAPPPTTAPLKAAGKPPARAAGTTTTKAPPATAPPTPPVAPVATTTEPSTSVVIPASPAGLAVEQDLPSSAAAPDRGPPGWAVAAAAGALALVAAAATATVVAGRRRRS
jgi:serine protease